MECAGSCFSLIVDAVDMAALTCQSASTLVQVVSIPAHQQFYDNVLYKPTFVLIYLLDSNSKYELTMKISCQSVHTF